MTKTVLLILIVYKGIHFLFFAAYSIMFGFLRLLNVNFVAIFMLFLLTLTYFYFFYQKHFKKLSTQLNTLHEINQARGMFVNIVSHEFRNPMSTIYSSVDLLENYFSSLDQEEKLHLFENIRKSIQRMVKIMDDIVLIGKLQYKQILYHPQETNIFLLCSTIYEALGPEKQRIQMTIDSKLPPVVEIDQSLLDLILTNLLGNALKYSEKPIDLFVKFQSNAFIFDVIDQGIGIPEEEIQKLSQLFVRCSNTKNREGIGIGMFLVAHCVKLHHGTLKVCSYQNKGTHFQVTIPISHV